MKYFVKIDYSWNCLCRITIEPLVVVRAEISEVNSLFVIGDKSWRFKSRKWEIVEIEIPRLPGYHLQLRPSRTPCFPEQVDPPFGYPWRATLKSGEFFRNFLSFIRF